MRKELCSESLTIDPFTSQRSERALMSLEAHGTLVPTGGGDTIELIREVMTIGRRSSCDVCLKFPNISNIHCQMNFREGYWYIRDLNSTNGTKVNGDRVQEKLLHPEDLISIGKRTYVIQYTLPATPAPTEDLEEDILNESLLQRAGLEQSDKRDRRSGRRLDPADFLLDDDEDDD